MTTGYSVLKPLVKIVASILLKNLSYLSKKAFISQTLALSVNRDEIWLRGFGVT